MTKTGPFHVALTTLLAVLCVVTARAQHHGVLVSDAWIREAPPAAAILAAYLTIENNSTDPITLTGASSPAFARVEIHRSGTSGGIARMVRQDRVEIPPQAGLTFRPGGYHLMLSGPLRPLVKGDSVAITLQLGDGRTLTTKATVDVR